MEARTRLLFPIHCVGQVNSTLLFSNHSLPPRIHITSYACVSCRCHVTTASRCNCFFFFFFCCKRQKKKKKILFPFFFFSFFLGFFFLHSACLADCLPAVKPIIADDLMPTGPHDTPQYVQSSQRRKHLTTPPKCDQFSLTKRKPQPKKKKKKNALLTPESKYVEITILMNIKPTLTTPSRTSLANKGS